MAAQALTRRAIEHHQYPFDPASRSGEIKLGDTFQNQLLALSTESLTKHFLAVGQSGSGKTTLFYSVMDELDKPFWAFDLKQDYRHIDDVLVLPWTELRFNPLKPPEGVPPRRWVQVFSEIFGHATSLLSGSKNYLMKKTVELYQLYNLFDRVSEPYPSLHELELLIERDGINFVRKQSDYRDTLLNRLESMNLVSGTVFDCSQGYSISELLRQDVVFEFDGLSRDVQNFLMEALFAYVYEYRVAQNHRSQGLNHVFFLDEGKRVFSVYKERQDASGIPEIDELTAKMREFGEGLVVADQEASKLTDSIKANTYTKALLPTAGTKQFNAMAEAMNLSERQSEFAQSLGIGEAVIQVGNTAPVPVKLDDHQVDKSVSDRKLEKQQRKRWADLQHEPRKTTPSFKDKLSGRTEELEEPEIPEDPQEVELSKDGKRMLQDVVEHPFKPLTERYNRFSSSYKGNKAKNELVDQGVVVERNIRVGDQKKLLQLTEKGREYAGNSLDLDTKQEGRGGIVHRYWQHQIKDAFEEAGWHSFLEKFDADVYVNMGNTESAIEVAMGDNPREIQHIENHLNRGFLVWVVCRNQEILEGLKQRIEENSFNADSVVFRLFRDFTELNIDSE
ncbi:ATP-binding protein [Haloarcula marismortui]|uniref:ATP-binding protein n=2 Tax=Haloarcula marismortui ATCC 33800 TaxID=662476 RepID=A0A8T8KGJ3_9EURY|nr:ATP-binding protein [Haloarcula sinaiiensis]QUJ71952.1 ATP-binding protein [Haloarcula sinaiiensis ATCC 33800]